MNIIYLQVLAVIYLTTVLVTYSTSFTHNSDAALVNDSSSVLEEVRWKLLDDSDLSSSPMIPGHPFSIKFIEEKSIIEVKDMCQKYELAYRLGKTNLAINQQTIHSENDACIIFNPRGYSIQSKLYKDTLFRVNQYQIVDGILKLFTNDGRSLTFWSHADFVFELDEFSEIDPQGGSGLLDPKIVIIKDQDHFEMIYSQGLREDVSIPKVDFKIYDVIGIFFGEFPFLPIDLVTQSINKINSTNIVEKKWTPIPGQPF